MRRDWSWEHLVLSSLRAAGGEADLQAIYEKIEELHNWSIRKLAAPVLDPKHLLDNPRWGRPEYQHIIRGYLGPRRSLRQRRLVEQVGRGTYRLTADGRVKLASMES